MSGAGDFERLAAAKHLSLTTFKHDGTPVATPVWVVSDDPRRPLVWTSSSSWKVKRLRANPHVQVAPCDFRGNLQGRTLDGSARLLPAGEGELVERLLRRKYPSKRPLDAFNALVRLVRRSPRPGAAYIEIRPNP